ncbi:methionyl aminopeptidase [Flagelloscypha sp. PMI_526]|nr:methionyl aminopeptidase [Flagelloscypha sp. PMI_526]
MSTCFRSRSSMVSRCSFPTRLARTRPQRILNKRQYSISEEEDYAFGLFSVVFLDGPPFIEGVGHITPRTVPSHIIRPHYARFPPATAPESGRIDLKNEEQVDRLRRAASLAKSVREYAGNLAKPGVTTLAIDEAAHDMILAHGAYPSPLLYGGYPRSICTSVNNIVTHGIPDNRPLEDGDIVNIDVTVYLDGFHGDTSRTYLVGDVDEQGNDLVNATTQALVAGITSCGPGVPFLYYGTCRTNWTSTLYFKQWSGHGIGNVFHKPPWIWHTQRMQPGDCFTIEPAIQEGIDPESWVWPDGWTASTMVSLGHFNCLNHKTQNGGELRKSSSSRDQLLITENGVEVLTL